MTPVAFIPAASQNQRSIVLGDFCPFNRWTDVGNLYDGDHTRRSYFKDETTGRIYLFPKEHLAISKALYPFSSCVGIINGVYNIGYRIYKLVYLNFFGNRPEENGRYHFSARAIESGKDLARLIATPIAIALEILLPFYAWVRLYDAYKLLASTERLVYEADYGCQPVNPANLSLASERS